MSKVRAILLSAVACLALALPLTSAKAGPTAGDAAQKVAQKVQGHHRVYWVYYRTCPHSVWVCHGGYHCHLKADSAVQWFRSRGYEAYHTA